MLVNVIDETMELSTVLKRDGISLHIVHPYFFKITMKILLFIAVSISVDPLT